MSLEQLALAVKESDVRLSVVSPRRLPAWNSLFEKSGGDLAVASLKHYARDLRHLVLLDGFGLQVCSKTDQDAHPCRFHSVSVTG